MDIVHDWKEHAMRTGEGIWENFVTAFLSEVRRMSDSVRVPMKVIGVPG